MSGLVLRRACEADVAPLLRLINGYAERNLLLRRSEASLREHLDEFTVAVSRSEVVACAALSELGPGLGEVRSLAVREDHAGHGLGHALVLQLLREAGERGFDRVLCLTRRVSFFEALGFVVTRRELFLDKLETDCKDCPLNANCDETALVRAPLFARTAAPEAPAAEGVTLA
jgi:amino-acid N-acetyltransferase